MCKKILKTVIMLAVLAVFVSCQEKKETKDTMNHKNNSEKIDKQNNSEKANNTKPIFRNNEKKCETCPKDKACSCDKEEAALIKEDQETLSQDIKPEETLPLEDFKASLNNQDITSEITEVENENIEIQE